MRGSYDARFPVSAAWALEFAPVNVSVVFVQPRGSDFLCVGSRSWFFPGSPAECIAETKAAYPWRVSTHILPAEDPPRIWQEMFEDLCIYNCEHAPSLDDGRRMLLTQRFLSRLEIDTTSRPWDPENNATLLDSLNGYRVKELASHDDVFTTNIMGTHEQYLTRALEHFVAHDWKKPHKGRPWGPPLDYSQHDKAVIGGTLRAQSR